MRRALMAMLMAATVASPLAAQTEEQSSDRRGGFGSRVREAVRPQRPESRQQETKQGSDRRQERTERSAQPREDRQATRERRRADRQAARQDGRDEQATRERPRSWGQAVNGAIKSEERQDRRRERLERQREREWNRQWRNDRRYDWQRWRYANSGLYSVGRYHSPSYGYRYHPLSIGIRLGSPFYANRYWISDPWQYRLPPAYPGTRWVRYYDDVVLVDLFDGQVVDVIRNFFW